MRITNWQALWKALGTQGKVFLSQIEGHVVTTISTTKLKRRFQLVPARKPYFTKRAQ